MRIALCSVYYNPIKSVRLKQLPISPPIGLGYIASYLMKNGHKVQIFDDSTIGTHKLKKNIRNFDPQIVGISTFTFSIHHSLLFAKWLKLWIPGLTRH